MSILEDALAQQRKGGPACGMSKILAALSTEDRLEINAILFERLDVQGAAIARALTNRGHRVSAQTVTRHRSGECSCERPR